MLDAAKASSTGFGPDSSVHAVRLASSRNSIDRSFTRGKLEQYAGGGKGGWAE